MNWWCVFLGHKWRCVYKNPWSQHPRPVSRQSVTKVEKFFGEERPMLELLVKCDRCEEERWI